MENNNNNKEENQSFMDMLINKTWKFVVPLGILFFLIGLAQGNSNSDSIPSRSESGYNLNNEEDLEEYIDTLDWEEQSGTGWSDN